MNNDRCSGMSAYVFACINQIHIERLWERGYVSHGDTEGDGGGGTSPPCTEGVYKKNLDLIYIYVPFHTAWLRPEQRIKRGTALQFPAQRGYRGARLRWSETVHLTLCGNGCEAAGSVFSVLAAAIVMGRSNKGICHKIFVG